MKIYRYGFDDKNRNGDGLVVSTVRKVIRKYHEKRNTKHLKSLV